jgi:putative ABC transport system permease protein
VSRAAAAREAAPRAALVTIARSELRRRWRSVVALGVLAGVVAAGALGLASVARRTTTAPDRLDAATHAPDAAVLVVGDRALADEVAALASVEASWVGTIGVGRLGGPGVAFVSLVTGPERPDDLLTPIVVAGRAPDPAAADEVLVSEDAARQFRVGVGDVVDLAMLAPDELTQFDTGFGDPDGPQVALRVTGVGRLPPGEGQRVPLLATPAFHAELGDQVRGAWYVVVRAVDGRAGLDELAAEVDALGATLPPILGAEEFPRLGLQSTAAARDSAAATTRVLTAGLVACLAACVVAGGLGVAQAIARHQAGSTGDQQVEAALGCTPRERAVAHALPLAVAAVLAAAVAAVGGLVAARVEPAGAVRRLEPHPGPAVNVALVVVGALLAALVVGVMALVAAHRAGRRRSAAPSRPSASLERLVARTGRPWAVAGAVFALVPGSGARGVPVRTSLVGAAVGVAGVAAVLTTAASLDRLVDTPERWGWHAELAIIDATDETFAALASDPRVAGTTDVLTGSVRFDGEAVSTYSLAAPEGRPEGPGWVLLDGRAPSSDDEVVLGSRVAERLGVGVGDGVTASIDDGGAAGAGRSLRVVGLGLGPDLNGEALGDQALVTPAALADLSSVQPFREALVDLAPGVDAGDVAAELGQRYELDVADPPRAVADLGELGALPDVLAGFLGAVAALALAHALLLTTRRRAHDLAVLRALGFTPAETGRVVATLALVVAGVGLGVGVPLGLAIGRLVWGSVAAGAHVATDPVLPLAPLAVLGTATVAAAVVLAVVPARRAARLRPARVLREG